MKEPKEQRLIELLFEVKQGDKSPNQAWKEIMNLFNNGVLDDVINCPNCKGSYVVKDLDNKFLCKDCGSKFFNRVDL